VQIRRIGVLISAAIETGRQAGVARCSRQSCISWGDSLTAFSDIAGTHSRKSPLPNFTVTPQCSPVILVATMKKNALRFDFSEAPLKNRAFSDEPMSFIDEAAKNALATIIDLVAIETGNRAAREHWQQKQLQNLLQHAAQRSAFWRERIGTKRIKDINLSGLPILTRHDVVKQVETEGCLLPSGTIATAKHATSGSTGTPVQFFVSEMNRRYNQIRTVAQYFMEERDLTLNRTRFKPSWRNRTEGGFVVEKTPGWLGPLNSLFKVGNDKRINHSRPNRDLLLKELRKDPIGYLVIQPSLVESLFYDGDISFLYENGTKMFIPRGEDADRSLRQRFVAAGILVRANYSSEEVGCIAMECKDCPEHFHVAQSNVIIEIDNRDSVIVGSNRLGRVLVTHLHSYATPFVRYDIGDFATLSEGCGCGHDGPVLSNIYGRKKRLIKHSDGSVSRFGVNAEHILEIVKCDEYRIRQTALDTIEVEIGGIDQLSADQVAALKTLFKERTGDEFQIRINIVGNINWGSDIKKLAFRSEVL
jgi:phenylacetate-coenzyme A ligase PaaK-like adenylate-forming protein